ncbi:hypothetical protein PR048_022410 [Dryococelus australis]|uniref:Uncharacterized protein n=1 Tax=Dryococelus australis TaxID=614101 RepID=A0ABQ9H106_9NEOP|nr:hypothetical protein PR048_022410 [Dryococelus australis]
MEAILPSVRERSEVWTTTGDCGTTARITAGITQAWWRPRLVFRDKACSVWILNGKWRHWRAINRANDWRLVRVLVDCAELSELKPEEICNALPPVRPLTYYQGEPGSIPGRVTPVFSQVGIVAVGATSRWVFSGISHSSHPRLRTLLHCHLISPSSALKTSFSRAAQISELNQCINPGISRNFKKK